MPVANLHFDASLAVAAEPRRTARPVALVGALAVSALVAAASIAGITLESTYAQETRNWAAQGIGQDWVDLLVAVPWLALSALFALRGSRRALLVLAGGLAYTLYEFVIYGFALHFNALFLVYCAVLGASFFSLSGVVARLARARASTWFIEPVPVRAAGAFLLVVGIGFGALWLGDVLPALFHGTVPAAIAEAGTPTNPVYVMDLSVVLPLHVIAGVALLRRRPLGLVLGPVILAFGVLMALSIGGMMLVMRWYGESASLGVAAVMVALSAVSAFLLMRLLRSIEPRTSAPR